MKKIIFFVGFLLLLRSAGFCAEKITNLPAKHWAYPYMLQAASYEVSGWWMNYADKDATRLNVAQIMSGYLDYLAKNALISKEAAATTVAVKDVPQKSESFPAVTRTAFEYKVLPCYRGGYFMPERSVPVGQFAIILAKVVKLNPSIEADDAELVEAIKIRVLDNVPAGAFKLNAPVKRYEVVVALIKTTDFIKNWSQYAKEQKLEAKPKAKTAAFSSDQKPQVRVGGLVGQLQEQSAISNSNVTYGGKIIYDNPLDAGRTLELIGEGSFYDVSYLMPGGGLLRAQDTRENKIDTQLNYKSPLTSDLWGGNLASVFGLRGLLLRNDISSSSLWGLRGGLEYAANLSEGATGKLNAGMTAKLLGENGTSSLGGMTSILDLGAEIAYRFSKDQLISLNYDSDALVFNQQNVRYFNTLMINSAWEF